MGYSINAVGKIGSTLEKNKLFTLYIKNRLQMD